MSKFFAVTALSDRECNDLDLAREAGRGDIEAQAVLYERHYARVYGLCLRMMKNPSDAEDMTQEVWIQVFRKLHSFRGESQFTTWLHRLTINQMLMFFRRKRETVTDEEEIPIQIVRGTEDPSNMSSLIRIALDDAISQLPDGYRSVFIMHDVEGLEHEEIATILGISIGTSKSQLHKARMKLRGLLRRRVSETPRIADAKPLPTVQRRSQEALSLPALSYEQLVVAAEDAALEEEE